MLSGTRANSGGDGMKRLGEFGAIKLKVTYQTTKSILCILGLATLVSSIFSHFCCVTSQGVFN